MTSEDKFYIARYLDAHQMSFDEWMSEEYSNDGKDPDKAITVFKAVEDLSEEAEDMMMNEPCGLTFGQLYNLLNDMAMKNISFDGSGLHISDVEEIIERYKEED